MKSNAHLQRVSGARFVLTLMLLLTVVLTACGNGGGETTTPAPGEDSEESVLRVAAVPISQTDPAAISSDSEVLVANHVYDYLVDVNPENEIVPRLATEWKHSDDGLTYVFALNEGVTFHDGAPLTAEDVVWTFDRLRNTEGLPTTDLYKNIRTIEATGDLEVTFTLSETNPFFLYDLSDNHALILQANTDDPTAFNGTGPFVVTDYRPEDRIIMEANADYFVEGQPMVDRLEIIFFSDQAAAADALRGGQIDLTMDLSTPLYESLQEVEGIETIDIATNQFTVVRLRTDREPGNDPRVVEAIKLATDRQAIFDLVQQGYGAVGRDSPVGPLYQTYYTEEIPIPERDPERARELLAEAGYPDGLDMEMHFPNTLNHPDLAAVIKNQWEEAGINVELFAEPESVYYGEGQWLDVNLGITGWGHRPYPQFYLDVMLACGAKWNEAHFCDEELDRYIEIAGTTLDEKERVDAYHEIQRILIERGPLVVPYFFAEYAAINDAFEGFELRAFSGRTNLHTIEPAE